ncbi:carbohydrate ABC transporter membrane protein 2 (CUT1 family) [Lacrimispora xylanisolvens]|uniref:Carbohydrate ABC transporter membrane protein 2 (CUT1 family) n=1 Tax=Lacrimispora xylanisolvens TaxID=384636 RepID=A0A2S6HYH6_9FIRM|nr:carbohydrate ABC transporter permease [Hungatella xylanolytica]PPK83204.1 carbohydrate ABC transporter membrane protein 2 (CUT1 family) [Hungatella xylanolytica]
MEKKKIAGRSEKMMQICFYTIITIFALSCLFPFLLMVTSSFMGEKEIVSEGYKLIPDTVSLSAYKFLFRNFTNLFNAYRVTIFIAVTGTVFGLFFMSMAGYVLCRKDFRYRNQISFFIYFTTLFSGGLIPTYMLYVNGLGLKDSIWSMVLPGLMSPWSIFLMKNFMKSIPDSLYESANIDGANDFRIYWQIYMPLAKASLATIGLFQVLGYWNEWYNAMLYIQTPAKFPLQYFLQRIVSQANIQLLIQQGLTINTGDLPSESIKMATAVIATGPIVLLYPFVQKYFVSGLTIGAVKG